MKILSAITQFANDEPLIFLRKAVCLVLRTVTSYAQRQAKLFTSSVPQQGGDKWSLPFIRAISSRDLPLSTKEEDFKLLVTEGNTRNILISECSVHPSKNTSYIAIAFADTEKKHVSLLSVISAFKYLALSYGLLYM